MADDRVVLDVRNLSQAYGGSRILRDVSLQARAGEITVVLGRNGVGKSTLLRTLMGLHPALSGTVVLDGRDISRESTHRRAEAGMGYVPQGREIFPRLSVEENLRMGFATGRLSAIPAEIYELFPVLAEMRHRQGGDLSGGQQQQLAIGRALCTRPKVLILDEPTEGIQPSVIKDIGRVVRSLADRGDLAVILVEQYYDFAEELADAYVVMERGEVIRHGRGDQMQADGIRKLVSV
ncbi:MAG TPA: urea ABC transporter ATP-binding subunit UrtE [Burkholderiaceae bacterium]|nr:urea ABC transporter ATP-binding subunit UrtE [Burkholderiaceae bacterium]